MVITLYVIIDISIIGIFIHLRCSCLHKIFVDKIDDVSCHKTKSFIVIMVRNTAINMYNRRKRTSVIPFDKTQCCISHEILEAAEGMERLEFKGLPAVYYSNQGVQNLLWYDETYMYMVSSTLDKDAVFKIAGSVKVKE